MPCDSRVTKTTMVDAERLGKALAALGYEVTVPSDLAIVGTSKGGREMRFWRSAVGQPYSTIATDLEPINAVRRKYSELTVRGWAEKNGYSLTGNEKNGRKLTFTNRRGG